MTVTKRKLFAWLGAALCAPTLPAVAKRSFLAPGHVSADPVLLVDNDAEAARRIGKFYQMMARRMEAAE